MGLTKQLLEQEIQSWEQLDHIMDMTFAEFEHFNTLKQKEHDNITEDEEV